MIRQSQSIRQTQSLQQRLSPQQIQYIKLLQLPTLMLEQRVKLELETNPVLEIDEELMSAADEASEPEGANELADDSVSGKEGDSTDDVTEAVDQNTEIDWDSYFHDDGGEFAPYYSGEQEDWRNLPKPYKTSFIEKLERQVELLDLDDRQKKIAVEIVGSIEPDGYLRRDMDSIIDSVAFNEGAMVTNSEAEAVLRKVQRLDPPGVGARSLQECLLVQLELMESKHPIKKIAMDIVRDAWTPFEKKHYEKIRKKLNLTEKQLREANQIIMLLDPKPGESDEYLNPDQFIIPDFEVYYEDQETAGPSEEETGSFVIRLNQRNVPTLRISKHYKEMWDAMSPKKTDDEDQNKQARETRQFIRDKMEAARWFIDSIRQRRHTLMAVMQTIVALQDDFFRSGKGIRPMILKDVAERIRMDISTVSRVVNGKYVQTPFGVYELKYFFTEGLETDSGESISNREIKNLLTEMISAEDKSNPLSDQALAEALKEKGYPVARRTISKYREQLNIPVARLRKDF